jgi:HEAT repeats
MTLQTPSNPAFTGELSHLVWLLVYRPTHLDAQKGALRRALALVAEEGCRVSQVEVANAASDLARVEPRPDDFLWMTELATRMGAHAVRVVEVHQGARAVDVLGLARALAGAGAQDDGRSFDAEILALAPTTLTVHLGRTGFVRTPTPPGGMRPIGLRPVLTPPMGQVPVADAIAERGPRSALETPPGLRRPTPEAAVRIIQDAIMPPSGDLAPHDLVMRLRGELTADDAPPILDEIGRMLEVAATQGRWDLVVDVVTKLLDREETVTNPDVRRAFGIQFRRLAKPSNMRGIIDLLLTRRELRDDIHRFLQRQGEPAADLLVEMLVAAEGSAARRAYRDAILKCPSAAEPLMHLLRDHRWFVVRNAAELLGELNATEADQELINTSRHSDVRVRRAATLALIRLGTPRAMHTMLHALKDEESAVRRRAASGLGATRHNSRAAAALLAALDDEEDQDVIHAILAALGHHASAEVVARLIKESTAGSILRRRATARRVAAIAGGNAGGAGSVVHPDRGQGPRRARGGGASARRLARRGYLTRVRIE